MPEFDSPPVLGIDLGGTKILAAVVADRASILGRAKVPTPAKQGGPAIVEAIAHCARQAIEESGVEPSALAGACIGSPGPLDTDRGVILFSSNLAVEDFPIGPEASAALGLPVMVQNDVRAGGYGELRLGAGRGYRDVLAAFVGTGIGGCVVVDGKVVVGAGGNAGEIGHIALKPRGPKCGCGRRGCLEALASRSAIARRIAKACGLGAPSVLAGKLSGKGDRLKSKDLAAAFAARDALAVREVERSARFLGQGLGSLVNVLGPEVVIVGGGVVEAIGEPYVELVRASARRRILVDPAGVLPIVAAALGDDAGILGAALLARERFAPGRDA
jgi:glucokinase